MHVRLGWLIGEVGKGVAGWVRPDSKLTASQTPSQPVQATQGTRSAPLGSSGQTHASESAHRKTSDFHISTLHPSHLIISHHQLLPYALKFFCGFTFRGFSIFVDFAFLNSGMLAIVPCVSIDV